MSEYDDEEQQSIKETFTLSMTFGIVPERGFEYGDKALLDALIQEMIKENPGTEYENAVAFVIGEAVTRMAEAKFGKDEADKIWSKGHTEGLEKFGFLPEEP